MTTKTFEIRDKRTFIPAIAIQLTGLDSHLLRVAGYGDDDYILFLPLPRSNYQYDPYAWNDRTCRTAHLYIIQNFDKLPDNSVVDVEYILGETAAPKIAQHLMGVM